jgi:hypothetical protein
MAESSARQRVNERRRAHAVMREKECAQAHSPCGCMWGCRTNEASITSRARNATGPAPGSPASSGASSSMYSSSACASAPALPHTHMRRCTQSQSRKHRHTHTHTHTHRHTRIHGAPYTGVNERIPHSLLPRAVLAVRPWVVGRSSRRAMSAMVADAPPSPAACVRRKDSCSAIT